MRTHGVRQRVGFFVSEAPIEIQQLAAETIHVPIVGTAPLIVHRFSEKAKRLMLDNMQGRKAPKEMRDPQADYEACFHRVKGGGYGFPVTGFKQATVSAARFYGKNVTMVGLRQVMFFTGHMSEGESPQQLAVLTGEPHMREDVVRYGQTTDLVYRPEFFEWSTTLTVTYVKTALSRSSVLSLIDAGGLGVGVGEWRPLGKNSTGEFGTYRVDPTREVDVEVRA